MTNLGPTWEDVVARRNQREDEPVRLKFAPWAYLGRGHMDNSILWNY